MNNDELELMYNQQQYCDIINQYNKILKKEKEEKLNLYAGFSFLKMGYPEKAIQCLTLFDYNQFREYYGKISRYIGLSNYLLGNYQEAHTFFCRGEENGDEESELWNRLLFPALNELRETKSIIFRFVDKCSELDKKLFIFKNLTALTRINNFIGEYYVGKKIDIYVYFQRKDSMGNTLSYSDNGLKTIHTHVNDVVGHEIAHILFNSIYKNMNRNQFIDEGIATFFNEDQTFNQFVKKYKPDIYNFDVIKLWQNPVYNLANGCQDYYCFAGAFVGYLIEVYGKEKFLAFIKNEDIVHAKIIFGSTLDTTIQQFYTELNKVL